MDLNKLQDRKKYNQWNNRNKNAYSFYMGQQKKSRRKTLLISSVCLSVVVLIGGLVHRHFNQDLDIIYGDLMVVRQKDLGDHEFDLIMEDENITIIAKEYLATMGVEAKIAQLLITTPEILNNIGQVVQAGESTKKKLMQYPVGGLIYSSLNFETIEQVEKLINHTKLFTNYPTFLAMDASGTAKIINTNHDLAAVGINMDCSDGEYLIVDEEKRITMDNIRIEQLNGRDPVKLLQEGVHMLDIRYSFANNVNKILLAVKDGTISEDEIDEKVIKVLEYKLSYGID